MTLGTAIPAAEVGVKAIRSLLGGLILSPMLGPMMEKLVLVEGDFGVGAGAVSSSTPEKGEISVNPARRPKASLLPETLRSSRKGIGK